MKYISLIWMLSVGILLHTQEVSDTSVTKKKTPLSMQFGAGLNCENRSSPSDLGYGIHLMENSLKMGFYAFWGAKITIKQKFNIGLQLIYRTQTRNKNSFYDSFEKLFPDKIVIHADDITNPSRFGFRFSFSYLFNLKTILIAPKVNFGTTFGPKVSYDYVLRTPSTNYFERYRIYNKAKVEYPISLGFDIALTKVRWLELTTEFGFSKNQNIYNVYNLKIDDSYNKSANETIHVNHNRFFLT